MNIQQRAAKVLQQIDDQLALAEKATPGPWETDSVYVDTPDKADFIKTDGNNNNVAFIAASRSGWPVALRCLKSAIEAILATSKFYYEPNHFSNTLTTLCDQWEASR